MNFGWFTDSTSQSEFSRTTIHEFGHALGLVHEHQHPTNNIPWNRPAVYDYYYRTQNPPWTPGQVDFNIFARYSAGETSFSQYDPSSIMHYAIPSALLLDPSRAVGWNTVLSLTDKDFISRAYPSALQPRHRNLYQSANGGWEVADRLIGKSFPGYTFALSGNFRTNAADEIILIRPDTGANSLLYQDQLGVWRVVDNVVAPGAVNGYSMAVAFDSNADGRTDLFFNNVEGHSRLIIQQSDGSFTVQGAIGASSALNGFVMVVANDFDGNGRGDLFFLNLAGDNRMFLQNALGTFTIGNSIATTAVNGFERVVSADFDANGLPDLFLLNYQGDNRLLLQISQGNFALFGSNGQIAAPTAVNGYNHVVASDFNNDGRPDLLFLNLQSGDNRLILQAANGQFTNISTLVGPLAVNNYFVAVAGRFDFSSSALDLFLFEP